MIRKERAIVRSLRLGVVPHFGISGLTVGCADASQLFMERLTEHRVTRSAEVLLVKGEWGTGKSHVLAVLKQTALELGFASMSVAVDARSLPLNYPQRIFVPLVEGLQLPGAPVGLRAILADWLEDAAARERLIEHLDRRDAVHGRDGNWVKSLSWLATHQSEFGCAAAPDALSWTVALGGDMAERGGANYRQKALARIRELALLLRAMGAGGVVLSVDEAETLDHMASITSRLGAYETLGCFLGTPGIFCVMGITDRFSAAVGYDVKRHPMRWGGATSRIGAVLSRLGAGTYPTISPPVIDERAGFLLASRAAAVYAAAYAPFIPPPEIIASAVEGWLQSSRRDPRRLLRAVVAALDRALPLPSGHPGPVR